MLYIYFLKTWNILNNILQNTGVPEKGLSTSIVLCWPETMYDNQCERTRHLVVGVENHGTELRDEREESSQDQRQVPSGL